MDTAEALSAGPPAKGTTADAHGPWISPSKTVDKAQVGQVSWLEAALLAFPGMSPQWHAEQAFRDRISDL